jgi:glycosyltransferase involved in cell wall biosynthesis
MPAEKECYGVVFAEANAFGLPCFASAISGITNIFRQGENGALLPPDADAHAYVQAILPYLLSNQHYQQIARQSRIAFDRRLNWGMAGIRLSEKMQATIAYKQE